MWRTVAQQRLDHVTVAVFDRSDERCHTVLVFEKRREEKEGRHVRKDEGYDERDVGQKIIKRGRPFSSMSRGEG
jgi:hypothetical protein